MGVMDWHKNVTVSLTGGYANQGTVQGGPFAADTVANVVLGGRYGVRDSFGVDFDGDGNVDYYTQPFHYGLDLWVPTGRGTPIYATGSGVISFVFKNSWNTQVGNWIEIEHPGGWRTRYAHLMDEPQFVMGETVVMGQMIGRMNNTGASTGDHLHYEIRQDGANIDPLFSMIAAPDVGEVLVVPMKVGDDSPDLHRTIHDGLQYLFREGTVILPLSVIEATGDERFFDKEAEPHLIPQGTLMARYILSYPVVEVDS